MQHSGMNPLEAGEAELVLDCPPGADWEVALRQEPEPLALVAEVALHQKLAPLALEGALNPLALSNLEGVGEPDQDASRYKPVAPWAAPMG
jgi:hypothetical protein